VACLRASLTHFSYSAVTGSGVMDHAAASGKHFHPTSQGRDMGFNPKVRCKSDCPPAHDHSCAGFYFVTLCTYKRRCLFGDMVDGELQLSKFGATGVKFPIAIAMSDWVRSLSCLIICMALFR